MIDRNFYMLMSRRFGSAFDNLPHKRKGPGSDFMRAFEQVKRDFGYSGEDTIHELPLNMPIGDPNPEHYDDVERLVKITE